MWLPIILGIAGLISFSSRGKSRPVSSSRESVFFPKGSKMGRGLILPLTVEQRIRRALYLSQAADSSVLDSWVENPSFKCPDIYYRLKDYNGGKNPKAPHPASIWYEKDENGIPRERRTCDCIGGAAWIGGWDRYQPVRFSHLYGGWINTDSMLMDANGPRKCFAKIDRPVPGCYVVCASGSPGHKVGHIGTVISVPDNWDASRRESWQLLSVVDVANRSPKKVNAITTGSGWYGARSSFVVSVMT